jgi:hypothetical protein
MENFDPSKKIYLLNEHSEEVEKIEDKKEILDLNTIGVFEFEDEDTPEEYSDHALTNLIENNIKSFSDKELDLLVSRKIKINTPSYCEILGPFFRDENNSRKFIEILTNIEKNNDIKFSDIKNKKTAKILKSTASNSYKLSPIFDENKISFYGTTNQSRKFFSHGTVYDSYSYVSMMFNLPESFAKTESGNKYIHSVIDGKDIALLGGGHSLDDLILSNNLRPKKVFNFDPYLESEDIPKNTNNNYESIPISTSSQKLEELLKNGELERVDEIWATYSVPYYLNTKEEIKQLISNIMLMLNEGGNARISPISFQSFDDGKDNYRTRRDTFLTEIDSLLNDDNYNVSVFNETLKIHKIKR